MLPSFFWHYSSAELRNPFFFSVKLLFSLRGWRIPRFAPFHHYRSGLCFIHFSSLIHRTKKRYSVEFLFFSLSSISIYTNTHSSVSLQPTTFASLHLCLILKVCVPSSSFLFFESLIFMPPNPTRKKKPNHKIKQKHNKT